MLPEMARLANDQILITAGHVFFRPASVHSTVEFRTGTPGCRVVAGATDLGVELNKKRPDQLFVLSTSALPDFDTICVEGGHVTISHGVSLSELQRVAAKALPELAEYLEWFGSPQIRNAGTLAGNLANASPIGDMLPPLFVLDAQVVLVSAITRRSVNINDFYTGYRADRHAPR